MTRFRFALSDYDSCRPGAAFFTFNAVSMPIRSLIRYHVAMWLATIVNDLARRGEAKILNVL